MDKKKKIRIALIVLGIVAVIVAAVVVISIRKKQSYRVIKVENIEGSAALSRDDKVDYLSAILSLPFLCHFNGKFGDIFLNLLFFFSGESGVGFGYSCHKSSLSPLVSHHFRNANRGLTS